VILFNVDEGLVMAMGDDGRASHYTGQATTGKACPSQRGGSPRVLLSGGLLLQCNDRPTDLNGICHSLRWVQDQHIELF